MKLFFIALVLMIAGVAMTLLGFKISLKRNPPELMQVSGTLSDHNTSGSRYYQKHHYFSLKQYACTFMIPMGDAYSLDKTIFNKPLQEEPELTVSIDKSDEANLQTKWSVINVKQLEDSSRIYLKADQGRTGSLGGIGLMIGIPLVLAGVTIIILHIVNHRKPVENISTNRKVR